MRWAYYNEWDKPTAAWLRELIKAGLIAPGEVDERNIQDVKGEELREFRQCHFFAGIGGWAYALRLAGWPDDKPVWTGSCPCQPFSIAGKRKVDSDERHLWPAFRTLISEQRPTVCFGEQVAGKDGRIWLARVRADLEGMGYACGAADLCAAGISAPHLRQRVYWVANSMLGGEWWDARKGEVAGGADGVGKPDNQGWQQGSKTEPAARHGNSTESASREYSGLGNTNGYHEHWWSGPLQVGWNCIEGEVERGGRKHRAQWRIKPGLSLLADGIPGRVAQLCGFGNAIVPQVAAEFIGAFMDCQTTEVPL